MHDVIEVTCTGFGHTHLVVYWACDWIAVSGRPQVVIPLPIIAQKSFVDYCGSEYGPSSVEPGTYVLLLYGGKL